MEAQSTWTTLRLLWTRPILDADGLRSAAAKMQELQMACRSKRRSSRSKRRPRNQRNSAPKLVRLELNAKVLSDRIVGRRAMPSLPNMQDNLVVRTLATTKIGDLLVDHFGRLLCKEGDSPDESHIIALRLALIRVYFASANMRLYARATQDQRKSAQAALNSLTNAIEQLDRVRPPKQRGLQAVFGGPVDDFKGIDELNELGLRCSQIRMNIIPIMRSLTRAIEDEKAKPKSAGERSKRLRTLVEALADWWESKFKKSMAPYVYAKRLGKGAAFVVGRQGNFIELAKALFSGVDEFTESEVISAVTNVHESRLKNRTSE